MSNKNNKKIYDPIVESSISDQEDFDTLFDQPHPMEGAREEMMRVAVRSLLRRLRLPPWMPTVRGSMSR